MALYSLDGGYPTAITFDQMFDGAGRLWTDLRNNPAGLAACGFVLAPDPPSYDPTAQALTWADGAWSLSALPGPTLEGARSAQLAKLQQFKATALSVMAYVVGGVTYPVTLTVQDIVDVQSKVAVLQAQPAGTTTLWEIVDNVFLTWELADVQALEGAGLTHIDGVYSNAAALVAQINAATTVGAVQAIDVTQGWPA